MTKSVLIFVSRKPGMSFDDFKAYYEDTHMALIHKQAGPHFPETHTRRYIRRPDADPDNPGTAIMTGGTSFSYDAIAELTFPNEEAVQALFAVMGQPENTAARQADEEKFLDRSSIRVVMTDDVIKE